MNISELENKLSAQTIQDSKSCLSHPNRFNKSRNFLGSHLQISPCFKSSGPSTCLPDKPTTFGEDFDHAVTPHPNSEPSLDLKELLNQSKGRAYETNPKNVDASNLHKPVPRKHFSGRKLITENQEFYSTSKNIIPSPIRRTGNPLPLNSPFGRKSPGFFDFKHFVEGQTVNN